MSVTETDRERAREVQQLLCTRGAVYHEGTIAAALAEEREKARAPFLALAEEIEAGHASTHTVLHDCHTLIRRAAEGS